MDILALRLSLQYGHGDTRWFERLDRSEQVRLIAYETRDQKPKQKRDKGDELLRRLDAQRKKKAGGST